MSARERRMLADVVEWAVSPRPPLPAVADTDAVAALHRTLALMGRAQRIGLRLVLLALELAPLVTGEWTLLGRLPAVRRATALGFLERRPLAPAGAGLAALAKVSYYGDERVLRQLGYDSSAVVARGRALRDEQGRW